MLSEARRVWLFGENLSIGEIDPDTKAATQSSLTDDGEVKLDDPQLLRWLDPASIEVWKEPLGGRVFDHRQQVSIAMLPALYFYVRETDRLYERSLA